MGLKIEQKYICFINMIASMGYSLVAPLLPPLCKEKGISNQTCSYIISILALVQIIISINFPILLEKFGRKKIFFTSLIVQTLVTIYYGLMNYINNTFYFILSGYINRIIHGIACASINIICFTITSLINKGPDLEIATGYMELSWMIGLTIGPFIISIFFSIGGYSLPYFICGLICLLGIYSFYKIPEVDENLYKEEKVNNENNEEKIVLLPLLKYPQIFLLTGAILMEGNSFAFFIPTLVNHLNETWNVSTSKASLFFLSSTISYVIVLQKIHELIKFFGNFPLISLGLILTVFTSLVIAPISFLPHSYWTILTGIIIQGINGCFIIVPSFVELTNFSKYLFPNNIEMQNVIPSTFFNVSFYFGDFVSPIIGSYFTSHFSFEASAYFTSFITFIFWLSFSFFYKDKIKLFFEPEIIEENIEKNKVNNLIPINMKEIVN